jgi:uncharacterized cupin superfamily protein
MSIVVEHLSNEELKTRGVATWPVWEKEVSDFEYTYDETEQCYFLDGSAIIETLDGNVQVAAGDFVTFPKGLMCTWHIKSSVRKHYKFGI